MSVTYCKHLSRSDNQILTLRFRPRVLISLCLRVLHSEIMTDNFPSGNYQVLTTLRCFLTTFQLIHA